MAILESYGIIVVDGPPSWTPGDAGYGNATEARLVNTNTRYIWDGNVWNTVTGGMSGDGDFVHKTGNETIDGIKSFTSAPGIPAHIYSSDWNGKQEPAPKDAVYDQMELRALDSAVVHKTGDETIGGTKTFSVAPVIPAHIYSSDWNGKQDPAPKDAVYDQMELRALDSAVVHKTGDETIGGIKTFSVAPVVPAHVYSSDWNGKQEPAPKDAVYDQMELRALDSAVVHKTGDESIGGTKTFQVAPVVPLETYGVGWEDDPGAASKADIYDKIQMMLATMPLQAFKVLLDQAGTSAPTYDETHTNSLGATPSLGRPATGRYTVTLLNGFPVGKCHITWNVTGKRYDVDVVHTSASVITIEVKAASGDVGLSDLQGKMYLGVEI